MPKGPSYPVLAKQALEFAIGLSKVSQLAEMLRDLQRRP